MEPLPGSVEDIRRLRPIINDGLQVVEPQEGNEEQAPLQLAISRQNDETRRCTQFVSDGLQVEPLERCEEQPPLQIAFSRQEKEALCLSSDPQIGLDNARDRGPRRKIDRTLCNQRPAWKHTGVIVLLVAVVPIAILIPLLLVKRRQSNSNRRCQR